MRGSIVKDKAMLVGSILMNKMPMIASSYGAYQSWIAAEALRNSVISSDEHSALVSNTFSKGCWDVGAGVLYNGLAAAVALNTLFAATALPMMVMIALLPFETCTGNNSGVTVTGGPKPVMFVPSVAISSYGFYRIGHGFGDVAQSIHACFGKQQP